MSLTRPLDMNSDLSLDYNMDWSIIFRPIFSLPIFLLNLSCFKHSPSPSSLLPSFHFMSSTQDMLLALHCYISRKIPFPDRYAHVRNLKHRLSSKTWQDNSITVSAAKAFCTPCILSYLRVRAGYSYLIIGSNGKYFVETVTNFKAPYNRSD